MLHLVIPCIPPRSTSQSRTRIFRTRKGKAFIGKSNPPDWTRFVAQVEHKIRVGSLSNLARDLREAKAVCLTLVVAFPYPKGTSKALAARDTWRTTKPDADNLAKAIVDLLVDCQLLPPDQRVARLIIEKLNSPKPRLEVLAAPLNL